MAAATAAIRMQKQKQPQPIFGSIEMAGAHIAHKPVHQFVVFQPIWILFFVEMLYQIMGWVHECVKHSFNSHFEMTQLVWRIFGSPYSGIRKNDFESAIIAYNVEHCVLISDKMTQMLWAVGILLSQNRLQYNRTTTCLSFKLNFKTFKSHNFNALLPAPKLNMVNRKVL